MRKDTAAVTVETMRDITGRLNNSIFLVMEAADEEEVGRYKKAIGQAMGDIFLDIVQPILDEYPDLTPEALRSPNQPEEFYDPK